MRKFIASSLDQRATFTQILCTELAEIRAFGVTFRECRLGQLTKPKIYMK